VHFKQKWQLIIVPRKFHVEAKKHGFSKTFRESLLQLFVIPL